jgi:hypothetical protein
VIFLSDEVTLILITGGSKTQGQTVSTQKAMQKSDMNRFDFKKLNHVEIKNSIILKS